MDLSNVATVQNARNLFNDDVEETSYDEINTVSELPGVDGNIAAILKENGIDLIQDFVEKYDENAINIADVSKEDVDDEESEETTEESSSQETEEESQQEEEYFCPECGAKITLDMTQCPNCGVEFEFTEDEE